MIYSIIILLCRYLLIWIVNYDKSIYTFYFDHLCCILNNRRTPQTRYAEFIADRGLVVNDDCSISLCLYIVQHFNNHYLCVRRWHPSLIVQERCILTKGQSLDSLLTGQARSFLLLQQQMNRCLCRFSHALKILFSYANCVFILNVLQTRHLLVNVHK